MLTFSIYKYSIKINIVHEIVSLLQLFIMWGDNHFPFSCKKQFELSTKDKLLALLTSFTNCHKYFIEMNNDDVIVKNEFGL